MLTGSYSRSSSAHPSLATADECYAAAKEQYPNAPYIQFKDSKTKCDWCCQVKGLSVEPAEPVCASTTDIQAVCGRPKKVCGQQ